MADKILCFSLNGFPLAVEPEQIEKILINKHPTKNDFVLETGVEVKNPNPTSRCRKERKHFQTT